jgi:hypothetical protein
MFSMFNTSVSGLHECCDSRRIPIVQQISVYGGSRLLAWLRLATSGSTRFGAVSPTQLYERFSCLMLTGGLDLAELYSRMQSPLAKCRRQARR